VCLLNQGKNLYKKEPSNRMYHYFLDSTFYLQKHSLFVGVEVAKQIREGKG
jgi:hypothetical protein